MQPFIPFYYQVKVIIYPNNPLSLWIRAATQKFDKKKLKVWAKADIEMENLKWHNGKYTQKNGKKWSETSKNKKKLQKNAKIGNFWQILARRAKRGKRGKKRQNHPSTFYPYIDQHRSWLYKVGWGLGTYNLLPSWPGKFLIITANYRSPPTPPPRILQTHNFKETFY